MALKDDVEDTMARPPIIDLFDLRVLFAPFGVR